ncbi:hypothetical protein HMPREF0372_02287 [Flavonifractor plautii ATCC 29863]|uniref:Uncharacterized protein n=1 Tax=Flavonifractor plautii ATCC 29863 TaxID=411475 RepID=G9YRY2_FLAPL|nr:hypothetical protein HMPREF0372_02287 [Flavonifractor plautii ATCC 29863]
MADEKAIPRAEYAGPRCPLCFLSWLVWTTSSWMRAPAVAKRERLRPMGGGALG